MLALIEIPLTRTHKHSNSHTNTGPRNKCTMGLDVKLRSLYRSGDLGSEPRWLLGGSFAALRFSALVTGEVD